MVRANQATFAQIMFYFSYNKVKVVIQSNENRDFIPTCCDLLSSVVFVGRRVAAEDKQPKISLETIELKDFLFTPIIELNAISQTSSSVSTRTTTG